MITPVKFTIHETPSPNNAAKKTYHVRPEASRSIKINDLIFEVSSMSSFSSADIKGMLAAFFEIFKHHLERGHTVELEGIGTFNISISCPKNIEDPSKINAAHIRFKKINFKSSAKLNNELRGMTFSHSSEDRKKKVYTEAERQKRILNYLKTEKGIQSSLCMSLNSCSRYTALKDLESLIQDGKVKRHGKKASSIYILAE